MEPDGLEAELFCKWKASEGPRKTWAFELAHNGTLYLDEVSDMPLETQGGILRVLIDQAFTRVGGQSPCELGCARHPLHHTDPGGRKPRRGVLAKISYHRLNVEPVRIPSLQAERWADGPVLVSHFMNGLLGGWRGLPTRIGRDDAVAVP